MRIVPLIAGLVLALPVWSQTSSVLTIHSNYSVAELLQSCRLADSDARDGQAYEIECEQYLIGYVDALEAMGAIGPDHGICLPEQNVADETRWAFVRWVYGDFSARTRMMAAEGALATLKDSFGCAQ